MLGVLNQSHSVWAIEIEPALEDKPNKFPSHSGLICGPRSWLAQKKHGQGMSEQTMSSPASSTSYWRDREPRRESGLPATAAASPCVNDSAIRPGFENHQLPPGMEVTRARVKERPSPGGEIPKSLSFEIPHGIFSTRMTGRVLHNTNASIQKRYAKKRKLRRP